MPEDPAPIEVGLLECDHVAPHLLEIGGDYADMFAAAFARHAPHVRFVRYDAVGGHLPEDPRVHDAWLVTGSRWSVYDDEPWIAALLGFIRRVDAAGGVLVGVCFGHQAIAHALGGQTTRSERGWGVGVHEAALTARRPWMDADGAAAFGLLMTHQDQVRRLPPGASVLACSDHCEVALYEVDGRFLGVQGHPEFSPAYAEALLGERLDRIPPDVVAAARATMAHRTDEGRVVRWIAAFMAQAGQRAAAG